MTRREKKEKEGKGGVTGASTYKRKKGTQHFVSVRAWSAAFLSAQSSQKKWPSNSYTSRLENGTPHSAQQKQRRWKRRPETDT